MYTIYYLCFSDESTYIGMTSDLGKRIRYYKKGKIKSTKGKKILSVLEIEKCSERIIARQREKYWKSGCGREKLNSLKNCSGMEQSGSSRGS